MPRLNKSLILNISLILNVILIPSLIYTIYNSSNSNSNSNNPYPYLAPRLLAAKQNDYLINFVSLRDQLNKFAHENSDKIGLYFEYLPTGSSIGVNSNDEHQFASLLKVPVVMAYYLQVQKENLDFNQTFEIKPDEIDQEYGDLWQQGSGIKKSAKELITLILTKSDNTALNVLADNVKKDYVQYVFSNLDIDIDRNQNRIQTISPRKYSSIYKALYLSSILPRDKSNEILQIMINSDAKGTIEAGVPTGIQIANKIGILHNELYWDCGIIYVPNRPYSLCIFNLGVDEESKKKISTVSRMIYDYVSKASYKAPDTAPESTLQLNQ